MFRNIIAQYEVENFDNEHTITEASLLPQIEEDASHIKPLMSKLISSSVAKANGLPWNLDKNGGASPQFLEDVRNTFESDYKRLNVYYFGKVQLKFYGNLSFFPA